MSWTITEEGRRKDRLCRSSSTFYKATALLNPHSIFHTVGKRNTQKIERKHLRGCLKNQS